MFDLLNIAIDSAISSGAKYSDARILVSKSRNIAAKNGEVENFNESEKIGLGPGLVVSLEKLVLLIQHGY